MPEEVTRINHGFHMYQSIEVVLEVLDTPDACLCVACVAFVVVLT